MESEEKGVQHVADIIGEWGKYQLHFNAFCFVLWAVQALNIMGYSFYAYDNKFWCSDVPQEYPNKTDSMKCQMFTNISNRCTEWTYDRSEFQESIITEFNLVCDRSFWPSLSQTIYMLGYAVSGLVFAHYSDKYGRRPIIWLSFLIEITSLLCCTLSPNIYMYVISRFFLGIGTSGRGMAVDTMMIELCGPKYRSDIFILSGLGWVLGYILLPGLALWLQNFRYMQLFSLIAMLPMVGWFYLMDESPRWQITCGNSQKAELTLRKALKINGKSDSNLKQQLSQLISHLKRNEEKKESEKNSYSVLDLVKKPKLRRMSMIFWYFWIVNALIYYGFSFNMSDFGGNFYITFLLSGLIELPSQILSVVFLRFIGRRKLLSAFMCITGMSCLAIILSSTETLKVCFALFGKFGITSAWNVISVFQPELYPTVIRHTANGASSVVGRIGSISAPFMKDLGNSTSVSLVQSLYSILAIFGAILSLFLPETKGKEIPDSIEEAENNL